MDRRLLEYLPPVLQDVLEFQAINEANEPELRLAWGCINLVLNNQFLEDAGIPGVSMWEQELKIHPKDTDTMAERKTRIRAMWGLRPPYTLPWLRDWLSSICGPDGHWVAVTDYTLNIQLDGEALHRASSSAQDIMELLRDVLPENLWWEITTSLEMQGTLHIGGVPGAHVQMGLPQREDDFDFHTALHAGGTSGIHASVGVYEAGDDFAFRDKVFSGGKFFAREEMPIPESTAPPPATTILRTGGVCTIISNLSKGE